MTTARNTCASPVATVETYEVAVGEVTHPINLTYLDRLYLLVGPETTVLLDRAGVQQAPAIQFDVACSWIIGLVVELFPGKVSDYLLEHINHPISARLELRMGRLLLWLTAPGCRPTYMSQVSTWRHIHHQQDGVYLSSPSNAFLFHPRSEFSRCTIPQCRTIFTAFTDEPPPSSVHGRATNLMDQRPDEVSFWDIFHYLDVSRSEYTMWKMASPCCGEATWVMVEDSGSGRKALTLIKEE